MNNELEHDMLARQDQIKKLEEREIRKRHNTNFVQIEKKTLGYLNALLAENPTAGRLLMLMGQKMNKQNAVMISNDTLAKLCNVTKRTIISSVKYLTEHKWIQVIKVGTSNAYVVNSHVFWQSYGNLKITSFSAQIIASSDEQKETLEKLENVKLKHFPFVENNEQILLGNNELPDPPCNEELEL